jgi:hypothetical protein
MERYDGFARSFSLRELTINVTRDKLKLSIGVDDLNRFLERAGVTCVW